jgi:hypothetical protein
MDPQPPEPRAEAHDETEAITDLENLNLTTPANHPSTTPSTDNDEDTTSPPPQKGRATRAREKQRANRQAKRAAKREASKIILTESAQDDNPKDNNTNPNKSNQRHGRRHRPSPVERSMHFFIKIYGWSSLFFRNLPWIPYLNATNGLDAATIRAISETMKKDWLGEGSGRSTRQFRSAADLERFVKAKKKELSYVEKQLRTMPDLQDHAWDRYFEDVLVNPPEAVGESLAGPADFMRDTVLPCLKAQIRALDARMARVRQLERQRDEAKGKYEHQRDLRALVESLRQDQALLLPICPVWKEIEREIAMLKMKIVDAVTFSSLSDEAERLLLDYNEMLIV